MTGLAINTMGLSRTFGGRDAVVNLSIEIPRGSIFGLLGPNGAGKTTTIKLLLGLTEPSGGNARVLDLDVRTQASAIRQRCGALLEHAGLYERLTAEENLDFFARIWRFTAQQRRDRVRELLAGIGLWDRRKEIVAQWSRGMKQKLAIARALLHRPELVFLDEPTAGLDPSAAHALRHDLLKVADHDGVTLFITTHNLAEASKFCERVGVLKEGRLIALGTPAEVMSDAKAADLEDAYLSLVAEAVT